MTPTTPLSNDPNKWGGKLPFHETKNLTPYALILASLWGATGGSIIAQALNPKVVWYMRFTFFLPFCSLLITKPSEVNSRFWSLCTKINQFSLSSFSFKSLTSPECLTSLTSFVGGVALSILSSGLTESFSQTLPINNLTVYSQNQMISMKEGNFPAKDLYPESIQTVIAVVQAVFIALHFLGRILMKTADGKIKPVPQHEAFSSEKKCLLSENTELIREKNKQWKEGFQRLKHFIDNDPVLLATFQKCYEESKDILVPPFEEDDSPPVSDPTAEEWRRAAQRQLYYEELLNSFKDFLNKNPKFTAVFKERLQQQNQAACLELIG